MVYFCSRIGVDPYFDKAMNTTIAWNMDLLGGYKYEFLNEAAKIKSTALLKVNNPSILRELEAFNPDVVLTYGYTHLTSLHTLSWCGRTQTPLMIIADSELKSIRSRGVRLVKRLAMPLILRRFQAFLTVGDSNEEYYASYGVNRKKFFRSPFTIDEEMYRSVRANRMQLRKKVRENLGISEEDILVLTVGKLSFRKRPCDVVEVAREVAKLRLPIRFVLAGNGELFEDIKAVIAAESLPVHLAGFVNVDVLPSYYAAADVVLHPSSRDPHPLVMSEAACVGMPLVISDRVGALGPTDIARLNENALVFPCGDTNEITGILGRFVRNPELISAMSQRSTEIFDETDIRKSVEGAMAAVRYCLSNQGGHVHGA